MSGTVFIDPPSPRGFVAFRHSHGGYGECCRTSRLKFPTLDLFHAATLLLERGHAAAVVDSVLENHDPEACVKAVLAKKPSAAAFRTSAGSLAEDLAVAELLRRKFDGPIVFFGPQAGVESDRLLESPAVDAVLVGEPPFPFLDLARDGGFGRARGFRYKRRGKIVENAPSGFMTQQELDALPAPRWDLVDFKRYSYVTAQTSWGCPFRCGYCPYPVTQGERWRTRSIPAVVREFQTLRARHGLRFVLLRDPEFSLERRRTVALCRALAAAGTPLMWGCETRLDTLDGALMDEMAEAGCVRVAFGVDSINPAALELMGRRGPSPAGIRRKVAALKKRGILTYGMYIIGLPGETRETTGRLIDFALELGTNAASFSMATPFAGTRLARLGAETGRVEAPDPRRLTGCVPSMRTEALSLKEVEELYLSAKARWNASRIN